MVLVKKWPFFKLFFFGNIGQKNVFYDSLKRENDFLCHKKKSLKSRKVEIFPKALTHRLGQKGAIFPTFFFRQYRPEKRVLRYSRTKKLFSTP